MSDEQDTVTWDLIEAVAAAHGWHENFGGRTGSRKRARCGPCLKQIECHSAVKIKTEVLTPQGLLASLALRERVVAPSPVVPCPW